jgi:hypothetical protein
MSPQAAQTPKADILDQSKQKTPFGITTPVLFSATVALLVALYEWPRKWLISGTPILTFIIILGAAKGYRVLPFVPLWTLLTTLNLAYSISATSWLLYWIFAVFCYPVIFLVCLFQFDAVAKFVRRNIRKILKELQFVNDKIAFFNIPALEIDVDGNIIAIHDEPC